MTKLNICFVTNTSDIDIDRFFKAIADEVSYKTLAICMKEQGVAIETLKDLGVSDFASGKIKSLVESLTDICIDSGKFFEAFQETIKSTFEMQDSVPDNILVLIQTKDKTKIKSTLNYLIPTITELSICGSTVTTTPMRSVYLKRVRSKDSKTLKQCLGMDFTYKFDLGASDDSVDKAAPTLIDLLINSNDK